MSADRVANGAEQNTLLLNAINVRMQQIDPAARPKLVLFGESRGAHTSQDVFLHRGTDGLAELGVDRALWTGTPYRSKWSRQVTAPEGRPDTDPRAVGVFNSIEDFEALPKPARDDVKAVMLTHDNDPVGHFGIDMLLQRPGWLGTDRPASVPAEMSWMPGVSFMQSLLDAKNAATVIPGEFKANGHDYRADLAPFVREAWGFDDVGDAELDRIVDSLVQDELTRSVRLGD
jgi:uncharacterized membrane protein